MPTAARVGPPTASKLARYPPIPCRGESHEDRLRSPLQNPYAERPIGSLRRESRDHVIVLNERHLRRILRSNLEYYLCSRTQLSLNRNAPIEREVEPPSRGRVLSIPQVGWPASSVSRAA
jgi:hypothetical protein